MQGVYGNDLRLSWWINSTPRAGRVRRTSIERRLARLLLGGRNALAGYETILKLAPNVPEFQSEFERLKAQIALQ